MKEPRFLLARMTRTALTESGEGSSCMAARVGYRSTELHFTRNMVGLPSLHMPRFPSASLQMRSAFADLAVANNTMTRRYAVERVFSMLAQLRDPSSRFAHQH